MNDKLNIGSPVRVSGPGDGDEDREAGATATEYAVLMGFIAIVITVGVLAFGTALNGLYEAMTTTLSALL